MTKSIHSHEYQQLTAVLRKARRDARLTQKEVADRLGKPQSYIAKIERAERRIDIVEFIALAEALGIKADYLFRAVLEKMVASDKVEG